MNAFEFYVLVNAAEILFLITAFLWSRKRKIVSKLPRPKTYGGKVVKKEGQKQANPANYPNTRNIYFTFLPFFGSFFNQYYFKLFRK